MYGVDRANTILNNSDHILYLGGQDLQTAQYIGNRTNRSPYTVLNLPLHQAIVLERGKEARFAEKIPPQYTIDLLKSYEKNLSPKDAYPLASA